MKRISLCIFLFLMFCNIGFAEECIKGDCINGQGTAKLKYQSCLTCEIEYIGEYKDGKKHGQGTFTYTDEDKYVGEYKNGKMHGQGIYTFADGAKYIGEVKNNEYHGQGTFTFPDGRVKKGVWENGKLVEPN